MNLPSAEEFQTIIQSGLQPKASRARKVIIVGAGMAGLVAAYELKRAGHEVIVLEARQRVGGRIQTIRQPFSPGLYAEAGAMRLPPAHQLVRAYIEKFGLQITPFSSAGPNNLFYLNGRKHLGQDLERDPHCLGSDFKISGTDQTVLQFWTELVRQTADKLKTNETYWDGMVSRYGDDSLSDFLKREQWPNETISAFASAKGFEPMLADSFLEVLRLDAATYGPGTDQIVGGMERLPAAFLPELQSRIRFDAEMVAIDYTADSVTIHYKSPTGLEQTKGDFAILALPFPALRFVDVLKSFSPAKQIAIRELAYLNIGKVLLEFRHRFWEMDEDIFGGASVTDLPIRVVYYPDHGRETGRGILLGCFVYGEDARVWTSLPPEERIRQALKYLAQIHPQATEEFEIGVSKMWGEDRFAGGACAWLEPGQQSYLFPHIRSPEGPIYFAGEHTTFDHWIEGAIESGLRAAKKVHMRAGELGDDVNS